MDRQTVAPVRMHPAFRGGKLTPWGGEKLKTVFGKEITEIPTGESLEISCIPGLESRDDAGRKLTDLIAEHGESWVGKYAGKAFPLLLKLIDAREPLSVQVHPDDAYAGAHEGGKLGKTEAWLILDCPEGAELVYGIRPGTDLDTLREASLKGSAVEPLLRRVTVRPGDVCNIPAGTVHAIGAGILLYEIQQSSDVTYRFYDWDRTDARGNRRELHLQKALDVTRLQFAPDPTHWEETPGVTRMLEEPFFSLDLIRAVPPQKVTLPAPEHFGFLTALDEGLTLIWPEGFAAMKKGESFFLPCRSPGLCLEGNGRAALSMPRGAAH
ncbi:MAG: class I mannose-6-phosphate isomerase [Clostridia bacterium]|nr:class I mannose-6-phosphate isomerase [Clostridia bacterium]